MLIGFKILKSVIGKEPILVLMTFQGTSKFKRSGNSKRKGGYWEEKYILGGWLIGQKNGVEKEYKRSKSNTSFCYKMSIHLLCMLFMGARTLAWLLGQMDSKIDKTIIGGLLLHMTTKLQSISREAQPLNIINLDKW